MTKQVYVVGGYSAYIEMFRDRGWSATTDLFEADLVVFCGGSDVDPSLYGEYKHSTTYSNIERDNHEKNKYELAKELGIPCAGICRGGQFLHVMNGGSLYQNVDGHTCGKHEAILMGENIKFTVSSTHHQMMRRNYVRPDCISLVLAQESTVKSYMSSLTRSSNTINVKDYNNRWDDIEVLVYTDTQDLCFQPHPEFKGKEWEECRNVFFKFIDEYLMS